MNRLIAVIIIAALFMGGCTLKATEGENTGMTYRQITMDEAVNMMETETGYIILDVRTEEEYAEGHIPGALLLPLSDIERTEPEILPDKQQLIMVYCRSGNRSKLASEKLARLGYSNIVEFGGIQDWPGDTEVE